MSTAPSSGWYRAENHNQQAETALHSRSGSFLHILPIQVVLRVEIHINTTAILIVIIRGYRVSNQILIAITRSGNIVGKQLLGHIVDSARGELRFLEMAASGRWLHRPCPDRKSGYSVQRNPHRTSLSRDCGFGRC